MENKGKYLKHSMLNIRFMIVYTASNWITSSLQQYQLSCKKLKTNWKNIFLNPTKMKQLQKYMMTTMFSVFASLYFMSILY